MTLYFLIGACIVSAVSGLPGLLLPRRSAAGQYVSMVLLVGGGIVGIVAALTALIAQTTQSIAFPGVVPAMSFHLHLDSLSAFFMMPIFLLGIAGPIYGLRYWPQVEHARNGKRLSLCYGLLVAALAMVTLAGDGITFLMAWEIMALAAFFLVCTEDHRAETRRAGWVYLIATHAGTLALFGLFAMLRMTTGAYELRRLQPSEAGAGLQAVMFLVALFGFGFKAGIMPLHFWLPGAHAAAPSHVSAILSAVVLKIGIYGIVRTTTLLPGLPLACGLLVLILGVISAIFGVAFALGQHDLKRLLAYHSIENIGIILMGLGLAMTGMAAHRAEWFVLGMAGCLLHVWNHSLFKSLLFLAAGSVVHATATREIDLLGGLARHMPRTAAMFAVGAIAICGLPPLNGFVSELLIYLGLFNAATATRSAFAGIGLAAPALAIVGALAVTCFVKAYGAAFLGTARTAHAEHVHESPISMIAPMALLGSICIVIGIFPILVFPLIDHVLVSWPGAAEQRVGQLFPQITLTVLAISIVAVVGAVAIVIRRKHLFETRAAGTWDCGYLAPRSSIQYTASSFASELVALFRWVLRPVTHIVLPAGLFPSHASFESHVPEAVLDRALSPMWDRFKLKLGSLRALQQGRVQHYLMYILLALFGLLLSLVPIFDLLKWLLRR